jgi:CopG family transcriptional regulator, nickel-responsive regulator
MRRMTISMDDDLADLFDQFMEGKGYTSRSEAIRDLLRGEIGRGGVEEGTAAECVGTLSYVFNHHERQLASRLAAMHHDHHDLTVSAMHAHLDHDNCLETVILRGPTRTVLEFAESVIAEKGVRHGKMHVIPVDADHGHSHGHGQGHRHSHARPRT